ncbi:MAG TPA: metallophosphoesterase family protein [Gaiellaceae bacterium]|nr:metallophosphoesterase family protein [Gaiellaceae bacterium]
MTLVAVIADTHLPRGARRLPAGCVERLRGAHLVLHAGDFVSAAFVAELESLGPPVAGVYGNMDEPALKETLPRERVVEVGGARIGMVHVPGPRAGREGRLAARFPGCDAVVYGHTHVPKVERAGAVWILNPGSPTERRTSPGHSMLLLRVDAGVIQPELVPLST